MQRLWASSFVLALCPGAKYLTSLSFVFSIYRTERSLLCLHHRAWLGAGGLASLLQSGTGALSRCRCRYCVPSSPGQKDNRPGDKFQLTFPLRTNYMYAKVKKSLPEMYAFTVCMWLKSSAAPGVGTPFSYAVPGQANELVLIEWGNNPMEILINDKVEPPPFLLALQGSRVRPPGPQSMPVAGAGLGGEIHSLGCYCGPERRAHRAGLMEGQGEDWEKWGGVPLLFSVNTGKLEPSQTEASQVGVEEEDPGANESG